MEFIFILFGEMNPVV